MNKTSYLQGDSRWGGLVYPKKPCYIRNVGCGEVSIANILIEMEQYANYTPATIQPYCKQYGAPNCDGTYLSAICKMMKHYGMTEVKECDTMPQLWAEMKKGERVAVLLMGSRPGGSKKIHWTSGGHFIAACGYRYEDKKHYLYIKDPWTTSKQRNGWLSYEESLKNDVVGVYVGKLVQKTEPSKDGKLTVDGVGGTNTIKATQKFFGVKEDGYIGDQMEKLSKYYPSLIAVKFGKGKSGSTTVKALQKWLGLTRDGVIGQGTTAAWQKRLRDLGYLGKKETIDGIFGVKSMKAWQKFLNDHGTEDGNTPSPKPTNKKTYRVIDVSDHQRQIDWQKVKADGIEGAIIRYADGDTLDVRFRENMVNARKAGLHIGSYIFSRAKTKAEAEKEAVRLFNAVRDYDIDMPLYIDLEAKGLEKYANTVAQAFIAKINELGGKPGVYANLNWWNNYLQPTAKMSFAMWVAQYNDTLDYKPRTDVGMWQYSNSGKVNGITRNVDMDWLYVPYWETAPKLPRKTVDELAHEVIDGVWGKDDERKKNLTDTGYDYDAVQNRVNEILEPKDTPQDDICAVAKEIADSGKYRYKKFSEKYGKECAICHPHGGENPGWNCIGYPFHCWHEVTGCKCSCQVMTNQLYEKVLKSSAKDALEIVRKRTGLTNVEVIVNKDGIPMNKLKKGDIIAYFNGDTYKHTALYVGDGKIADCTSGRKQSIKYGVNSYAKWKIKEAIRYTGK